MNLYEGEVAHAMGCAVYGIRPEHVTVSEADGYWHGTVRHVERLGADTIVHMQTGDIGSVVARVEGHRTFRAGQEVFATPDETREIRFDN